MQMDANGDQSTLKLELTELRTQAVLTQRFGKTVYCNNGRMSTLGFQISTGLQINAVRL